MCPRGACDLASFGMYALEAGAIGSSRPDTQTAMFLAARWGVGFVGSAIATFMTWRRPSRSVGLVATGILYIAMIFVLFGELTSMIPGRPGGPVLETMGDETELNQAVFLAPTSRIFPLAASISAATIDYNRDCGPRGMTPGILCVSSNRCGGKLRWS